MVYAGPSGGCQACKKRRIKCDETRPACGNCVRRKLLCPGFPDPPGTVFKDETDAVIQHSHRSPHGRSGERRDTDPSATGTATATATATASAPVTALAQDDIFVALCFFFRNYVVTGKGVQSSRGVFANLLPYYHPTEPDSLVSLAVSTVAASMHSLWGTQGPDSPLSRQYLARTIACLRRTLETPAGGFSDEALVTVLLLQHREGILAHSKMAQVDGSHQKGAYAMIKHRQSRAFTDHASKRLLQAVRSTMVSEAIRHRDPVNMDPHIWEESGDMPLNPGSDLDRIGVDVANLQAAFERYKRTWRRRTQSSSAVPGPATVSPVDRVTLAAFQRTAMDVDLRLELWALARSTDWYPFRLRADEVSRPVTTAGMYRDLCDVYPSVQIANIWHTYRSYRLILLKIVIAGDRARGAATTVMGIEKAEPHEKFRCLVDDICAAVPFHLGSRLEAGFIDEFADTNKVDYPWPPPERDPYRHATSLSARGHSPADSGLPMSADERKRHAIGMGGWHILGPISFLLDMAGEPLDLVVPLATHPVPVGSLFRPDHLPWLAAQLRRALILHRMKRDDASAHRPESVVRVKEPDKDAALADDVKDVKSAMRYAVGV